MHCSLVALGIAFAPAVLATTAAADLLDPGRDHGPEVAPLVLDDGELYARLTVGVDVRYQGVTQLLSLAPDVWWGLSPRWTIGLIHSADSLDRIDAVATLCLRDPAASPCPRWYAGGGVDVRYLAYGGNPAASEGANEGSDDGLAVAPRLRLIVRDVSPWKPAATVGALVRWRHGRFTITGDPYIRAPLANHTQGNRAALFLPVWLELAPRWRWRVFLHTGYDASFATLGDGGHVPVSLGLSARVTEPLELGIEAGWAALLGPQHDAKVGAVLLTAGWHR